MLPQLKHPFGIVMKKREYISGFGFLFRRELTGAVESDLKPIPFFLCPVPQFIQGLLTSANESMHPQDATLE